MKNKIKIVTASLWKMPFHSISFAFLFSRSLFIALFFWIVSSPSFAYDSFREYPEVQTFIQQLVKRHGFSKKALEQIFDQVKIKKSIIHQYNQPLEKETWDRYSHFFFTEERLHKGALFWKAHENTLKQAEKQYQVPAGIIVATLGVETLYGKGNGEHRAIDALANLAFGKNKRKAYFKSELSQLFLLSRDLHVSPLQIYASYAGAIGMPQFMPSSYREFAVSYQGHRYPDLMHNADDAIMSIANYYHQHGWRDGEEIAIPSQKLSSSFLRHWHRGEIKSKLDVREAEKYGIVPKRKPNSVSNRFFVLTLPRRDGDEYWLGFENFKVIKRYNSSNLYAMAVYQLSEFIRMEKENL